MPVAIPMVFSDGVGDIFVPPADVSWSKNPQVRTPVFATYYRGALQHRVWVTDDDGATERSAALYYKAIRVEGVRTQR